MSDGVARLAGDLQSRVEARRCRRAPMLGLGIAIRSEFASPARQSPSAAAACSSARTSVRLPSSILKALCPRPRASAKAASAAARDALVVERLPRQQRFGLARPPRHGGDAAERDARRRAPCRHRGRAPPPLTRARIRRIAGRALSDNSERRVQGAAGTLEAGDQLAGAQRGFDVGRVAGLRGAARRTESARAFCPAPAISPRRRARSGPARSRRDRSRCNGRWCRARRACG